MYNYIHSKPRGKKTRNGKKYYEEFRTEFWQKPGKYYLFLFIYLNFTECNLKFPNNIIETEYDRMHRVNQAAQAMLILNSVASSTNMTSGQDVSIQEVDVSSNYLGQEYENQEYNENQEYENQEFDNQEFYNQEFEN